MSNKQYTNYWWNTISLIPCIYVGVPMGVGYLSEIPRRLFYLSREYDVFIGGILGVGTYWTMLRFSSCNGYLPIKAFTIGSIIGAMPIASLFNGDLYRTGKLFPGSRRSGNAIAIVYMAVMSLGCGVIGITGAIIMRYSNCAFTWI